MQGSVGRFIDNQTVRAGDLLVKIDDRDYRAALDKATGAVEAERVALANLYSTRRLQEAMIAQAEAEVAAAEARRAMRFIRCCDGGRP